MDIKEFIIEVMKEWHEEGLKHGFDGMWHTYDGLIDEANIKGLSFTKKELQKAMLVLKNEGKVVHRTSWNYDYKMSGSGWYLDEKYFSL